MDAGELGTFLGNNVHFIDIDDHHDDLPSSAPCLKKTTSTGSRNESASSMSNTAFDDIDTDYTHAQKRLRVSSPVEDDDDFAALALEVESASSFHRTSMDISTPPAIDSLVTFFGHTSSSAASHLTTAPSTTSSDSLALHQLVNTTTPLMPPPAGADGVALGLPCTADISMLQSMFAYQQPQQTAPLPPQFQYSSSAFSAPQVPSVPEGLTEALNEVLTGKNNVPRLGLKLNIAAICEEMNNTTATAGAATRSRRFRKRK